MKKEKLDGAAFGRQLAEAVGEHLSRGGCVLYGSSAHDLWLDGGRYTYRLIKAGRVVFAGEREEFVGWLAAKSAASLEGNVDPGTTDFQPHLDTITTATLRQAIAEGRGIADATLYGEKLARGVATVLQTGVVIAYNHRDYCGLGLSFEDGEFRYGEVHDGFPGEPRARFATRERFVEWLAAQSDESLAGRDEEPFARGNQRLSRARLQEAISRHGAR